ncbi:cation:proton antiporter [Denitromonas ohlonensis]|uniref:Sodium:proton exchanger n=2 Tax=Denitromonas TaxID=139331 RepID=A0A557RR93_9RHOO|nr:cation:proton antiporter family protein [Denitromonas ohlonensis]TVO67690.1 sodium:proton exchanger [Denitromonas ohlonensis]TVO76548.1 sodium:proton exchanger [Denitromonas ohlonensis]
MHEPFAELALLLLIAAAVGAVAVRLRQPVLIAYIVVGIAVGPAGLELVKSHDQIDLLAQVGVAVLLFLVGLKLDLQHVRHIGPVALATGLGQLAFTIAIGFVLVLAMGRDWLTALYVAVALTFSSTIIIIKLLSDKRELESLHGRIAVGFLIVQDIAVVLAMMAMSALRATGDGEAVWWQVGGAIVGRVLIAAALLYVLMRYVLPPLMRTMARSQELLLIFAIAWGTALAAFGEWAGFSKEAGAFLAGFSLASTHFRDAIAARLTGIRDFLLLFFFIDLGAKLDFSSLGGELWPALVLSLFVLIGNPLIVMAIMGAMGYRKRTGFMAGLTVAQISEFSIIFVAMGITLGHVGNDALGLTTLVGIVTIALSTYMILYSQPLFERIGPWLSVFERRRPHRELAVERQRRPDSPPQVIIFGLGRYGAHLLARLHHHGVTAMGVDFDPETVRRLRHRGFAVRFGDGEDPAFVDTLPVETAQWIVTTLPTWESNRGLLHALQSLAVPGVITGVVGDEVHRQALHAAGASRIINPFLDSADHTAQLMVDALNPSEDSP